MHTPVFFFSLYILTFQQFHTPTQLYYLFLPERLYENFQARGMPRQFEQPEDSNDRKEFEDIRIFQMGGHLLKH